ncbi:MAG: acetyl-CoA carboxylase biotin carboxyl carrier protein [Puniceicoccales bacterium]|jgi:acetyl-CoA carboxylase biotin carboxyl carrier protein|nr:acetyl-CoA carboxylase biotin carboxyl carrier protein [Puniceicoccales bacterium]
MLFAKEKKQIASGQRPLTMTAAMGLKELERLVELAERFALVELEVERKGMRVRIRRQVAPQVSTPRTVAEGHATQRVEPAVVSCTQTADGNICTVHSPMVGTFYRSVAPEKPAFVEVGSTVSQTTTVCIVEAMKVMNEIPAEVCGTVVEVLAKDGQAVEFGQPLFRVRRPE